MKKAIEENVGIDYSRAKTYTVGSWLEVWLLPRAARRILKGRFSSKENLPFRTPREGKGCALDLPLRVFRILAAAHAVQSTVCNFLQRLSTWHAPLSAQPLLRRGYGKSFALSAVRLGVVGVINQIVNARLIKVGQSD